MNSFITYASFRRNRAVLAAALWLCMFLPIQLATAQSWQGQGIGLLPFDYGVYDVSVVSDSVVWAVTFDRTLGNNIPTSHISYVIKSTDAGQSWDLYPVSPAQGRISYDIQAFSADTAFITTQDLNNGSGRGVFRTTDGGTTWTEVFRNIAAGVWIRFFNRQEGIIINRQFIATTQDGGDSWTSIPSSSIPPFGSNEFTIITSGGGAKVVGDRIWFGTNAGRVYYSYDKGNSWNVTSTPFGSTGIITSVAFKDSLNGVALNGGVSSANLIQTQDGGQSWSFVQSNLGAPLSDLTYVPGTTGTLIGISPFTNASGSYISEDMGLTWQSIQLGQGFRGTDFIGPKTGWTSNSQVTSASQPTMFKYDFCASLSGLEAVEACNSFTWEANGQTYTQSGIYFQTLSTADGCDSTATLNLQIRSFSLSITEDDGQFSANASEPSSYQWIRCDSGNAPINGATDSVFTPIETGVYAVVASTDICSDTSDCVNVTVTSLKEVAGGNLRIFPNPASDDLQIQPEGVLAEMTFSYQILDMQAKVWGVGQYHPYMPETHRVSVERLPAGLYLLRVSTPEQALSLRFFKR